MIAAQTFLGAQRIRIASPKRRRLIETAAQSSAARLKRSSDSATGSAACLALDLPHESLEHRFVLRAFPAKARELHGLLRRLRFEPACFGGEMGAAVHALEADAELLKDRCLFGNQSVELALPGPDAPEFAFKDSDFLRRRRHLVEPGEREWVEPGGAG